MSSTSPLFVSETSLNTQHQQLLALVISGGLCLVIDCVPLASQQQWTVPSPSTRRNTPLTATAAMSTRLERRAYRLAERQHAKDQHQDSSSDEGEQDGKPAGGYDPTPLHPSGQTSFVVRFAFHQATNLPMSDLQGLASDPYLMVKLETPSLPKRHAGDPDLLFRTTTRHCTTDPVWNDHWIVGGIPEAGIELTIK